jgi:hypothetical protein
MILRAHHRSGISLIEVLIAIFVLALGLLSVLTLFPLGAVEMAQAIKDDRCAQANNNASTLIRNYWRQQLAVPANQREPFNWATPNAMMNVDAGDWNGGLINAVVRANNNPANPPGTIITPPIPTVTYVSSLPSYPVYIDPVGYVNPNNTPAQTYWVGGANPITGQFDSIPRRILKSIVLAPQGANAALNARFVQMDDMAFGKDGTAVDGTGNVTAGQSFPNPLPPGSYVQRDGRYTWAYMLRRGQTNLPDLAELTVIVYSGRSIDAPLSEYRFNYAVFTAGSTDVKVYYTGARPKIRRNMWILDGTLTRPTGLPQPNAFVPEPHGYFYRVINVNEDLPSDIAGQQMITLELQYPAQTPPQGTAGNATIFNGQPYGVCTLLEHVAEVFERRTLMNTTAPVP